MPENDLVFDRVFHFSRSRRLKKKRGRKENRFVIRPGEETGQQNSLPYALTSIGNVPWGVQTCQRLLFDEPLGPEFDAWVQ